MIPTIIGGVLIVAAVGLLVWRQLQAGKLRAITGTETSTVKQLMELAGSAGGGLRADGQESASGLQKYVEIKGTVRCDSPLTSEIGEHQCVYYKSEVLHEYEEREWDSNDKRYETSRRSETVSSNERRVSFWVEDGTGRILVDPAGADVDAAKAVDRFEKSSGIAGDINVGGFNLNINPLRGQGVRTLGFRYKENILEIDRPAYILGEAVASPGGLRIQKPGGDRGKFLISYKSEEELVKSVNRTILLLTAGALASLVAGLAVAAAGLLGVLD